jgi:asparaginyl-tRNA synthetase
VRPATRQRGRGAVVARRRLCYGVGMPVATVDGVHALAGQPVTLRGWLTARRSSGKLHFLQLRDGTGTIQCVVVKGEVPEAVFALADHLPQESSLEVDGVVRADPRSPIGFELGVTDLRVVHRSEPYPITPKDHGTAFLLDHRHLWLRSSRQHAVLRVRAAVIRACREYLDAHGFLPFDAPILTPAACEGTTTLFPVEYFGETAYLTQSGQLYGEAGAMAFGRVYCFGPTFRAEKSKTRRHLTEFWMVEPEMAFAGLDDDMALAEAFLAHVVREVLARCGPELAVLERDTAPLARVEPPFPRITYDEAIARLRAQGFPIEWGADLGAEEETALSAAFDRPVMVHRYPAAAKAFYMKRDPADPRLALCVDVLAPEGYGEIIGGGQREDDAAALEARIEAHGLPRDAFAWYLDLRRYGSVPHAGFGLGIERTVAWLCGLRHVRETIPFPRLLERLRP